MKREIRSRKSEKSVAPRRAGEGPTAPTSLMGLARQLNAALEQDPPSFPEFARKMGVGLRKGYYLSEIGRKLGALPISDHELDAIGWTKLQLIAKHINPDNARQLVEDARLPIPQLRQVLAGLEQREEKRAMLLYLSAEQFELFEKVILAHGGRRVGKKGLQLKEEALTEALRRLA